MRNGIGVPCMGFSTALLPPGRAAVANVLKALGEGYRLLDTATVHHNESSVAEALEEEELPREDVFISVKLWNDDRGYDNTLRAFDRSLNALRTDYIDLYLIHWPAQPTDGDWQSINSETWRALETLYQNGSVRAIGVCNFKPHQLDALQGTVDPMVNQIEFRPGLTQKETMRYCTDHDIVVQAWGPLSNNKTLRNPALQEIAQRYGTSVPQLVLRWCLQHNAAPLIRTDDGDRFGEFAGIFDFEITPEDMRRIDRG